MTERLLICTDLDRTLLPNGPQSESHDARKYFSLLAAHPEVTLAYVSGRHRELVQQAIRNYILPTPDFIIGDVGTTIYHVGSGPEQEWQRLAKWEEEIAQDWAGKTHDDLKTLLYGISGLRLQERSKQNDYKLSYYVSTYSKRDLLKTEIQKRLQAADIKASLIWSMDEPEGVGLLDVLPARASKYHAIEALMGMEGFNYGNTIFCGDSGNDIEVLTSGISSVLVANAAPEVRELALSLSRKNGHDEQLYLAHGDFMGMNGNYSAGMLEGIAHFHPKIAEWIKIETTYSGN